MTKDEAMRQLYGDDWNHPINTEWLAETFRHWAIDMGCGFDLSFGPSGVQINVGHGSLNLQQITLRWQLLALISVIAPDWHGIIKGRM